MNSQIEEIKERTDIVQVIGESVKLTKAGNNYKGLCPFHSEKTPSFMVSAELQIYKCFGCGAGGDVFTFLQESEGMEFGEALRYLADRAGIKLEPLKGGVSSDKEKIFDLQKLAANYYKYILSKHPEGQVARDYIKNRGLTQEVVEQFNIGFATERLNALSMFLKSKHGYLDKDLVEAGLSIQTQRGLMDRFRGRVIFPIYDHRGSVVALAGRILPQYDNGKMGKYINSPETAIYHKSKSLFGLNVSRGDIKRANKAVVVEGEIDAISSWQAGIKNVVAIKGSALTEEQVILLSRYARVFILALDADFAGNSAAIKAITQAQIKGVDILVADMAPHKDPDEFAQKDPDGYKKALEKAIGVWDFMIDISLKRHDRSSGEGKSAISREVTPVLASIPDKIVQSHYVGVLAQKLGVPADAVAMEVQKQGYSQVYRPGETKKEGDKVPDLPTSRREMLEERVLSLFFQAQLEGYLDNKLCSMFSTPALKKIAQFYVDNYQKESAFEPKDFYQTLPAELRERYSQLALRQEAEKDEIEKELKLTRHELELMYLKEELGKIAAQISEYESGGKKEKLAQAQQEFTNMSKRLAQIQEMDI